MARNIHWKVGFRTRNERLGVLNLYEEDYAGAVVELTPAATPFETQEDSEDNWFVPIRKQTGYIRVLDEGNAEGIMPVGLKDRYVEYVEDGVLKWCGYMVPDVFSSDWDVTPNEVEFPVIGGLGVLEGVYLNEDDGLGVVSLATLMAQCISESGIDYEKLYIPREVLGFMSTGDYLFPLKLEVSRYNFFSENESLNSGDSDWTRYNGSTCYDALSEIMKFWGWTLRERGKDLWITSTVNQGSFSIYVSDLEAVSYGGAEIVEEEVSRQEHDISSLELAGSDHKKDVLQGRKKVIVKASVNPVGAVIPSIDKAKMELIDSFVKDWNGSHYEKRKLYTTKEGYTDVELRSYALTTPNVVYDTWTRIPQSMAAVSLYLGAYYMEQELVDAETYKKKKNWNLTETIKINLQDYNAQYPSYDEARELPILIMKSRAVANYVNGAFVLSASTRSRAFEEVNWDGEGNGKGTMEVRFRVGGMYWNGEGWVDVPSWFEVEMGNEEDTGSTTGTGKIISTKTLDMPYNGADGYVMPIHQSLSGEVELTIHAVRNDGGYAVLLLDNFKVDYFGEDSEENKREESENRYAKTTGKNYTNEEEISLKMATTNNNKAGYGVLSLNGANIEIASFESYGADRPEMNLVKKGVSLYGRNTEKLTLHLDKVEANPQDLMRRNGKKYVMASESVNWADETGQYIIMEV